MPTEFVHGIEFIRSAEGPMPVQTRESNVIGLVGTALKKAADGDAAPINTPTLVRNRIEAAQKFGSDFGTIPGAIDGVFDQDGATIVVVNVFDPDVHKVAVAEAAHALAGGKYTIDAMAYPINDVVVIGTPIAVAAADVALVAGSYTIAVARYPISSLVVSAAGGGTAYVLGTDYSVDLDTGVITRIAAGSIPSATSTINIGYSYPGVPYTLETDYTVNRDTGEIARVEGGAIASATATIHVSYSYPDETGSALEAAVQGSATGVQYTGVHALLQAPAAVNRRPRILAAPGYASRAASTGAPGPVLAEMYAIADRLRAVIPTGGPVDDAEAITFRQGIDSERVYFVNTQAVVSEDGVEAREDASARVAGVIARTDRLRGWWHSPSNKPVYGIVGTHPMVDVSFDDPGAQSNQLNSNQIACIVQLNGFRLWGNEGCGSDPDYKFLSVVRTADILADSLQLAMLWAADECVHSEYLERVVGSVNAYIRWLQAPPRRAILGGRCWVDPAKNTAAQIRDGNVTFTMDYTPCYPARRITVDMVLTDNYIEQLFS